MRSRIVGACAVVLGLLFFYTQWASGKPLELKPLLGALAFVLLGGYYLITGKRGATSREFITQGKLAHEQAPAAREPRPGSQPDRTA